MEEITYTVVNKEFFQGIASVQIETHDNELGVNIKFNDGSVRHFYGEKNCKDYFLKEYGFKINI